MSIARETPLPGASFGATLRLKGTAPEIVAAACSLKPGDIKLDAHRPCVASCGAAGSRDLCELDKTEPILRENLERFCMFP